MNTTISIQETNNPTIIKFISNSTLTNQGSYEYANIDEAKNAPLAQQLFYLPFVKKVMIASNFIAIQRYDIVEWNDVAEEVRLQIEDYLNNGKPVVIETTSKKDPIEVYAEVTPNPSVMKFATNKLLSNIDIEIKDIDEASKNSPIAVALFNFPFVKEIFISQNYLSITKYDMVAWNDVFNEVRIFIRDYLLEGKKVISDQPIIKKEEQPVIDVANLDETSAKIVDILNEHIKPAVASDGGNIAFKSYNKETKEVFVVLQGACSGCPSSTQTLKNGIEMTLKEFLPNQINEVIAING